MAWGEIFAKTMESLGLGTIYFSPGSRSTPLILGIRRHSKIQLIPVLDERSAAFLALGSSKRTKRPCGLICTSGSALTHWFPAVAEASYSSVPLLLFSADRPPELQECGAGQTIRQNMLFGDFVRGFHPMELPSKDPKEIQRLIETLQSAYRQTLGINPGPVHLNFPFREPFLCEEPVANSLPSPILLPPNPEVPSPASKEEISSLIVNSLRPLVIAGPAVSETSILSWSENHKIPVLCDSLSPLRQVESQTTILRYENLLRDPSFIRKAKPDSIIALGSLPTSKTLRTWLDKTGATRLVVEPRGVKVDPLSSKSQSLQKEFSWLGELKFPEVDEEWMPLWQKAEKKVDDEFDSFFEDHQSLFEGKLAYLLSIHLPADSQLMIANSMPIRDVEWFWKKIPGSRRLYGNRGVNGIDGTLGTALGIAHDSSCSNFLLTGDLAFLHDSNALLFSSLFKGNLTVFVINNQGGGIFEHLPISEEPEFENFFATPQYCRIRELCMSFGVGHENLDDWSAVIQRIREPIESGIQVIEIKTDRKVDCVTRHQLLSIRPS